MVRLLMKTVEPPDVAFNSRTRAAFYGEEKTVRQLLEAGEDIEKIDRNSLTPLTAACFGGHAPVVELLCVEGAEVDRILHPRNSLKQTALQIAAAGDDAEICRILLNAGANPNGPVKEGSFQAPLPPLHAAAKEGCMNAVKVLLEAGADPGFKHGYSDTPLYYAVKSNSADILRALLGAGADPVSDTSFGNNPLHLAAIWESTDVIEPLVNAGLDVNGKTTRGETALDLVKAKGYREFEEKLKSLGAVE